MEFTFRIKVGATEITITENANSQREMFEKISFFSSLPTRAPNGADDLKIVYRKTKGGDEFYSIVSESEKQEYKFGIHKNAEKTLFPKGWEPLYVAPGSEQENETANTPVMSKPAFANRAVNNPQSVESEADVDRPSDDASIDSVPTPAVSVHIPKPKVNIPGAANRAPVAATPAPKPTSTNPAVSSILNKYLPNKKA